jgi:hypothetical protein
MRDTSPPHYVIIEKYFWKLKIIKLCIWISQLITSCLLGAAYSPEENNKNINFNSVVNDIIMAVQYVPCEPELHKGTLM